MKLKKNCEAIRSLIFTCVSTPRLVTGSTIRANTFYIEKWQKFFIQHFTFIFCSSSSSSFFHHFISSFVLFHPILPIVCIRCARFFLRIGYDGFVMVAAVRECANMDVCVFVYCEHTFMGKHSAIDICAAFF